MRYIPGQKFIIRAPTKNDIRITRVNKSNVKTFKHSPIPQLSLNKLYEIYFIKTIINKQGLVEKVLYSFKNNKEIVNVEFDSINSAERIFDKITGQRKEAQKPNISLSDRLKQRTPLSLNQLKVRG